MGWTAQCGSICLFDERLCTGAIARYPSSHKKKKLNSSSSSSCGGRAVSATLPRALQEAVATSGRQRVGKVSKKVSK